MNKEIQDLISKYEDEGFFTKVPPTQEMIETAQNNLGCTIPNQFLEYLKVYSYGGINGTTILGIGKTGRIIFLDVTLEYRKYGLPENLIVIENCDEWLYCIDANTGEVVSWAIGENVHVEYACFDDFLLSDLKEAIANL